MQTPKAKPGSLEVPQRKSPATTPRTARQLKTSGPDSESGPSPNKPSRTPKSSPKIPDRRSPRSPASEKKRPTRTVLEVEPRLTQLQEELRKAKEQLGSARQEAEEAKTRLVEMSARFEESERQLLELSNCEDDRILELRKLSQERDKAWESELEAVQKQHSMDSSALASAMNEVQKLKAQLDRAAESEAAQTGLRLELSETLGLVQELRHELDRCKDSEAQAVEDRARFASELDQAKARVKSLEGLVSKLQAELINGTESSERDEELRDLRAELGSAMAEVVQLRSALEAAEIRYQEEFIRSTLQIRTAYEQAERARAESGHREAELTSELNRLKAQLTEKETELQAESSQREADLTSELNRLKVQLTEKDTEYQAKSGQREAELTSELNRLTMQLTEKETELQAERARAESGHREAELTSELNLLKAQLTEKETESQQILTENNENSPTGGEPEAARLDRVIKENEALKAEIGNKENETSKANEAEQEARMKLGYATEEADKIGRRAARLTEQLDAAQAANSELEAELRRLKVQSDQWRKAAEAAASMLSTGNINNGSVEGVYNPVGSPYSEDLDDDSPKKKNGNVLKKIGVLWKKGQK